MYIIIKKGPCVLKPIFHDEISELDRRPQSAFKKNASLFIMCHQPGRQTKKFQDRKQKELRNEIMQPESSMDRGHFNSETQ